MIGAGSVFCSEEQCGVKSKASDADDLLKMLNPSSFTKSPETPRSPPPMGNPDTIAVFSHMIRQLVEDVGLLKASAEDMSIKFAHLGLRNLNECGAWITTQFKDFRYGSLIMDLLVMLDRIIKHSLEDDGNQNQFENCDWG
jgi:hypothetical protein